MRQTSTPHEFGRGADLHVGRGGRHRGGVTMQRFLRSSATALFALQFAALGIGVPLQGHTHHDRDESHVSPPGHGHGTTIVQHDMRLERSSPPIFVVPEIPVDPIAPSPVTTVRDDTAPVFRLPESRAPPDARPRAPPL